MVRKRYLYYRNAEGQMERMWVIDKRPRWARKVNSRSRHAARWWVIRVEVPSTGQRIF